MFSIPNIATLVGFAVLIGNAIFFGDSCVAWSLTNFINIKPAAVFLCFAVAPAAAMIGIGFAANLLHFFYNRRNG